MSFLKHILGSQRQRDAYRPLYDAVVNAGRDPYWYLEGQVPDTIDGRFDVIAALFALLLLRLEQEEEKTRAPSVLLTELFIDDMEGSIRQIGIGDLLVGKHVGRMVGALGGRLAAFRSERTEGGDFSAAVRRNIFHDNPPSEEAVGRVASRLAAYSDRLDELPLDRLLDGEFPKL